MNETHEFDRAARDLIEAGREGVVPNEFAVERIRRGVSRSLHASARPMRSRNRTAPILAALGAAALGGALYATELVRTKDEPAPAPKPVPAEPAPRAPLASPPARAPEPSSETTPSEPAPPPAAGRTPVSRSQKLAAEIDLLARVNAAVNAGEGTRALALLAEYDREFRPGLLGEERAAASVLALCAAGRTSEARAAAKRFSSRWQRSPLSARVSKSCAGKE
jgi:hypothetical protein